MPTQNKVRVALPSLAPDEVLWAAAREYWTRRPNVMLVESYTESAAQWDALPSEVQLFYLDLLRPVVAVALDAFRTLAPTGSESTGTSPTADRTA